MKKVFGGGGLLQNMAAGRKILNNAKDVIQPQDYFKNEALIRRVARAYAEARPSMAESSILGPDGNMFFVYSQPNSTTDFINKINNVPSYVAQLSAVHTNKHSQYLRQIQEGATVGVYTLSSFTEEYSGEPGRDFLNISPLEDFILKVSAVQGNIVPLPTLAERKFMYLWGGLKPVSLIAREGTELAEVKIAEDGTLLVPDKIIEILEGYKADELIRIKEAKEAVDEAIETGNYKKLIENYHYQVDGKGHPVYKTADGKYTGNAMKPTHFNSSKSVEEIFRDRVKDTLVMASELEAITMSGDRAVTNTYLPDIFLKKYRDKLQSDRLAIEALLMEYTINTIISSIETEKLLSGDASFHKLVNEEVFDDNTKRMGKLGASGDRVASNMENPIDESLATNRFNVIGLNTQIYKSQEIYDELVEKFIAYNVKEGMTEDTARVLAEANLSAYLEVDPTDAQVYISPHMFRQISKRLGEWTQKKQDAYDLLEGDRELTPAEKIQAMSVVMQPLKLVYNALHFEGGLAIPVYDKMSMATVFRQLAKDTQLEALYNRMTDVNSPAHMAKFDSAVKSGNRQQIDYFTDETREKVNVDALTAAPVYEQFFDGLYRQVITDPHTLMRRALGTQMKKVGLSNIQMTGTYKIAGKEVKGSEVVEAINKALINLSDRGKRRILSRLGVTEGSPEIRDQEELLAMFQKEAELAGLPRNIVDALGVDEYGEPYLELDAFPDRLWMENRLMSVVSKNTVDLRTAGGGFIQMSNFGLRNVNALKSSDLKLFNKEGKMEIMVSIGLFRDVIPGYKEGKTSFEDAKKWLKENLDGIGYRVPTQGLNSVISFVVKDFLPENVGDTVVLPTRILQHLLVLTLILIIHF